MRILKRLVWSALAALVALACGEAFARRFYPIGTPIFRLDDELLFAHIPQRRTIQVMDQAAGGARILIEIDEHGRRGPLGQPASEGARIGVYGDSLAFGGNVSFEETFGAQLEVLLRAAEVPCDVLNAGVTAYGPDQVLLKLERELPALKLDALVLVLCAHNDFGDLMRNKLMRVDDGVLTRTRATIASHLRAEFAEHAELAERPALWRALEFSLNESADGAQPSGSSADDDAYLIDSYLGAGPREYEEFMVERNGEVVSFFQDYYDADVALLPEAASTRAKLELMKAVLQSIRAVCDEARVPLIALVVPSAVDLDPRFGIRVDRERWTDYDPDRLAGVMSDAARAAGIATHDLTPLFRSEPGALFVGGDDFHWTALAQARAAAEVAQAVRGLIGAN